jgi:hypothetical protein
MKTVGEKSLIKKAKEEKNKVTKQKSIKPAKLLLHK